MSDTILNAPETGDGTAVYTNPVDEAIAILKERYHLEQSLSQLLHFFEVNLFEQKPLISIFRPNARTFKQKQEETYKQLTLFGV